MQRHTELAIRTVSSSISLAQKRSRKRVVLNLPGQSDSKFQPIRPKLLHLFSPNNTVVAPRFSCRRRSRSYNPHTTPSYLANLPLPPPSPSSATARLHPAVSMASSPPPAPPSSDPFPAATAASSPLAPL